MALKSLLAKVAHGSQVFLQRAKFAEDKAAGAVNSTLDRLVVGRLKYAGDRSQGGSSYCKGRSVEY